MWIDLETCVYIVCFVNNLNCFVKTLNLKKLKFFLDNYTTQVLGAKFHTAV